MVYKCVYLYQYKTNLFFAFTNFCGTMYEWWQDICHTLSSDLLMVKWFVARVADVWLSKV